ncbi:MULTISPECIES: CdaR family transcriptional regulator [unclassified Streptomyces]|uniref:PucR family transcriptional regulator n=1 Tax=unclassified Streptomyces TaxID=2593676 RepID=UPI00278C29FB|nr:MULTISPECIES: helix-turn-helix domain-containing protein [unclassified Streptomyces]
MEIPVSGGPQAESSVSGGGATLARVVRVVGRDVVEVVRAPCGMDVAVAGVGVFDAGESLRERGRVLIAVGVDTSDPAAAEVLRAADRAGAAALVVRRGAEGVSPLLSEVAEGVSTALLARAPWVDWGELIGLLRAALAAGGAGGPGGAGGVGEAGVDVGLGDLPGLAVALAALVGGAITIEDPESNVLAYSPTADTADPLRRLTILGRRVPRWRVAELAESGFLDALWAGDVVHRPADGRFPERLAVAVRAGDEVLGSLWAAADGEPLPEGAREALRQAAAIAVPHLLHHRLRSRSAAGRRAHAVRALFEEREPDVGAAAAALGVDAGRPCAVLAVVVAGAVGEVRERALRAGVLRVAAQATPAFPYRVEAGGVGGSSSGSATRGEVAGLRPGPRASSAGGAGGSGGGGGVQDPATRGHVSGLRPGPRSSNAGGAGMGAGGAGMGVGEVGGNAVGVGRPWERVDVLVGEARVEGVERLARDLAAVVRGAGGKPLIAVGPVVGGLGEVAESRARAGEVLRVLCERGGPEVAGAGDVRFALDALRVVDAVAADVPSAGDAVAALLAHDERHGTDLPRTVAAHLAFFGDAGATARYLGIHANTLRYRLRRARELGGLDLDDPDVRLVVELGLRRVGLIPLP